MEWISVKDRLPEVEQEVLLDVTEMDLSLQQLQCMKMEQ